MKTRAEQNPPAQIAVFNPVERGRKVRSGWLLLCYWDIIAQSLNIVKYIKENLRNSKWYLRLLRQIRIGSFSMNPLGICLKPNLIIR